MKDANGKEMTVRPFSNGTQYLDWEASNCSRCKKAASREQFDRGQFTCDIEKELVYGSSGSGLISDDIAARLKIDNERYGWPCGEWDPTEEWKAEFARRHR